MSLLLEIACNAGQHFDGITFRGPSDFTYTRVATNHYRALHVETLVTNPGIFDLRGMIEALGLPPPPPSDDLPLAPGGAIDVDDCKAQNNSLITDLVVERGAVDAPNTNAVRVGTAFSLAGSGVVDQFTPPVRKSLGAATAWTFGKSQYQSVDAAFGSGRVTTPTDFLFFIQAVPLIFQSPPTALLTLVPIYGCRGWLPISILNFTGP